MTFRVGNMAGAITLTLGLVGLACTPEPPVEPTPPPAANPVVTTIAVAPTTGTLVAIGDTLRFAATARDQNNSPMTGVTFTWASSDATVATVSSSGLTTALKQGSTTVSAASAGVTGSATLSVNQSISTVSVTPANGQVGNIGDTLRYTAVARDNNNNPVTGVTFTWTSTDPTVATVNSSGLVTALKQGTTQIRAAVGSVLGSANFQSIGLLPGFYVSTSGTAGGDGSFQQPWDLATALAKPAAVVPGVRPFTVPDGVGGTKQATVIWMLAGNYGGTGQVFTPALAGTSANPMILAAFPGQRVTIDGRWNLTNSAYLWLWGFESLNSETAVLNDLMGLNMRSAGAKLINMVVHDHLGNGIGFWEQAPDAEVYGSLVYNNGRQTQIGGRAHGIYVQNLTGTKLIRDVFLFHNLGFDLHPYGSETANIHNITVKRVVSINAGEANSGWTWKAGGMSNAVIDSLMAYGAEPFANLGPDGGDGNQMTLTNSYLRIESLGLHRFSTLTFTGNTLIGILEHRLRVIGTSFPASPSPYNYNNNAYILKTGEQATPFRSWKDNVEDPVRTFAQWQAASGYDASSTFTENAAGRPAANKIFLIPNVYEPGRANLVVYNWEDLASVSVNVSGVLTVGNKYEVRHVFNYYGTPVASGTYSGGSITVPMGVVNPVAPITGWPVPAPPTPGPTFGAFVIVTVP